VLVARHPLSVAIVAIAVAIVAGVFIFARPAYHAPNQGETIKLPQGAPAADAAGAAGWVWAKGTPGWVPGQMFGKHHDFNASGLQPVEVQAAQLAAAHDVLDAAGVRVLDSMRIGNGGPYAILASERIDQTPATTCLAVLLPGSAPVGWQCPDDPRTGAALDRSHVLLVGVASRDAASPHTNLFILGVAHGDVRRIVQITPGFGRETIYTRGGTWGQFETTRWAGPGARLLVYGDRGLAQTISLDLRPGSTRIVG